MEAKATSGQWWPAVVTYVHPDGNVDVDVNDGRDVSVAHEYGVFGVCGVCDHVVFSGCGAALPPHLIGFCPPPRLELGSPQF